MQFGKSRSQLPGLEQACDRQCLSFDNPALSVAAGCHGNTVDSWARSMQLIYDARLNFSLQGVRRFNQATDGSTHSCKDVLVGVIYSHENDTASHCPIQMILPTGSNKIKPDEMELADPIALLAQDNKVKRLSSHRQLQAISHQLHLVTCGRVRDLDYFRVPDNIVLSPVGPGETRSLEPLPGSRKQVASIQKSDGSRVLLLPSDAGWHDNLPLLVVQLDQGSVGAAGCGYAIHHLQRLIQCRWDVFHRSVRDVRLALQHTAGSVLLQAQMHNTYLWDCRIAPLERARSTNRRSRFSTLCRKLCSFP